MQAIISGAVPEPALGRGRSDAGECSALHRHFPRLLTASADLRAAHRRHHTVAHGYSQGWMPLLEWKNILPSRLASLRTKAGLSKTDLGQLVGVTRVSIHEFETGRKIPSLDTAIALAGALGVSLDWLTGYDQRPEADHSQRAAEPFPAPGYLPLNGLPSAPRAHRQACPECGHLEHAWVAAPTLQNDETVAVSWTTLVCRRCGYTRWFIIGLRGRVGSI